MSFRHKPLSSEIDQKKVMQFPWQNVRDTIKPFVACVAWRRLHFPYIREQATRYSTVKVDFSLSEWMFNDAFFWPFFATIVNGPAVSAPFTQLALPVFLGNRRWFLRTNTENILIFEEGYDMKKSIQAYGARMLQLKASFCFELFCNKLVLQRGSDGWESYDIKLIVQ